jgi:hypothetical protein
MPRGALADTIVKRWQDQLMQHRLDVHKLLDATLSAGSRWTRGNGSGRSILLTRPAARNDNGVMKILARLGGGAPLVALAAACSTSSGDGSFNGITCTSAVEASCMYGSGCESLAGPLPADYLANWQASCTYRDGGVFIMGPCPTAARAGGCVYHDLLVSYYSTPNEPLTPTDVMSQCADAGTYCP